VILKPSPYLKTFTPPTFPLLHREYTLKSAIPKQYGTGERPEFREENKTMKKKITVILVL